ncbi:hypothetical protein KVR01_010402 [Diaporthe batatas]|uniref:uncharacterized protein n=1 Tax=Diaporthe batatas TaxID=748121 RepID=UPI001D0397E1|nr:uncharacterized protein KVR01_010402 [Diaporthe batatas]KAG8159765.1 hypothetical protein KVR01_010402 [Diaporthe batatas]
MIRPRPPKTGFSAQQKDQWLMASQNKMRSNTAPESGELSTVDELMLHPGFLGLSPDEASGSAHRELLHISPDQDAQKHLSSPPVPLTSGSSSPDYPEPEGNTARSLRLDKISKQDEVSNASRNATKENCRLIRKFLPGRPFYPPKRGHFAALLSTPRTRDIILRPGLRFVADQPKKVRLLIVHMTGEEAPVPCNSCSLDRGPFKKCVAISKAAAGETTNGTVCCTNCACKRGLPHKCNVQDLLGRPAGRIKRIRLKAGPVSESKEQPKLGETGSGVTSLEATAERVTKIDNVFTFKIHSLPMDSSLSLDADPRSLRLCSVAAGKVMVELEGNMPFLIGTHGMFKLCPEGSAQVTNASGEEAVLHVSVLKV